MRSRRRAEIVWSLAINRFAVQVLVGILVLMLLGDAWVRAWGRLISEQSVHA
ncbi:hypothetical protein [Micromonospora sp. NPDC049204]|uniref:hypothetical protein n=1 Tax=unclassified Micromonospora TaxID=2617518 RepID=UPI0033EF42F6